MAILIRREQGFYRRLMRWSMPIVLQNLFTFSLGLIDTFMVSQLGNTEMAAVTAANVPVFLLISIVFGVQSGLGILVSQYWGKQDMKSISRSIGVASFVGAAVAAVLAAVLFLWPRLGTLGAKVPSSLVAVIVGMIMVPLFGMNVSTIGDLYTINAGLPELHVPQLSIDLLRDQLPNGEGGVRREGGLERPDCKRRSSTTMPDRQRREFF